ncbi:MAG: 2,4-dienoyl-CoA reductase-like NADH-dependent reductase (Old Yellow Enzyme family) [Myxococcota bacterium]|jgi:2,4-dienoyl-CoA reductase-like NADH-dependent reductase (Old Yellow Enzyme family)
MSNAATPADVLAAPLPLKRGAAIPNRLMKSAMSEVLSSVEHAPTEELTRLYGTWADGGVGLSVTGNVMIDRTALGEPRNVVVEDDRDMPALRAWAQAGTRHGGHLWMQINHPGKQSPIFLSSQPVSPSAVPLGAGLERAFATPRELNDDEILDLIERFGTTAGIAKKAGFTGVQIHGAHGYLVSQFLSPHHNRRTDRWGGTLERRASFALEVYASMRRAVGEDFPIGIKINSADFQRGGFTEEESLEVVCALVDAGMDLVEVSGGTYEAPAMTGAAGASKKESTIEREAYFLTFAETLRKRVDVPLALTGGFRTADGMARAVSGGAVDLVGLARALALEPDLPRRVLAGEDVVSRVRRLSTGLKAVDKMGMLDVTYYENQIARMGSGKPTAPNMSPWRSVMTSVFTQGTQVFQLRRARR